MILLDGKQVSEKIEQKLNKEIAGLNEKLKLAVVLVGNNPSSISYVNMKKKKCLDLGIECEIVQMNENISSNKIAMSIDRLNQDNSVTGIIVQLPLPSHINAREILDKVDIKKDVDGLNSYHLMKICMNDEEIIPATPRGVMRLLEEYNINLEGKNVCVVGAGDAVGRPLTLMCLNREASVDICHIKTKNLKQHTINADIIMSAAGVPNLIREDMVKQDAIIIDIGISKVNDKIVGDVDFENVKNKCSYITPVPGGVGPMTIISLILNLIKISK